MCLFLTCLSHYQVELDSGEFETLSDALQNLLLAPPYQPTRGRKDSAADAKRTNAEYHVVQVSCVAVVMCCNSCSHCAKNIQWTQSLSIVRTKRHFVFIGLYSHRPIVYVSTLNHATQGACSALFLCPTLLFVHCLPCVIPYKYVVRVRVLFFPFFFLFIPTFSLLLSYYYIVLY
jgi:hypothetical protein